MLTTSMPANTIKLLYTALEQVVWLILQVLLVSLASLIYTVTVH
jgi:hypothetical protein